MFFILDAWNYNATAWVETRGGFGRGEFVTSRSWLGARDVRVLRVVPGHAASVMVAEDTLVIGTAHGVSVYAGFGKDLRPGRHGWYTWQRIAALAASTYRRDRLGSVSCVDRYAFHGPRDTPV